VVLREAHDAAPLLVSGVQPTPSCFPLPALSAVPGGADKKRPVPPILDDPRALGASTRSSPSGVTREFAWGYRYLRESFFSYVHQ